MKRLFLLVIFIALVATNALAGETKQPTAPGAYSIDLSRYDFIDSSLNVIQYPKGNAAFTPFFNKLDTLVFENKGQVRILHVGGSHLQADVISGRIREHFIKEYPGASAGRGFVFPYSAARTNTPASYASYYKGIWDMNKNVQREIKKPLGLLGIAVSTSDPRAEISILLDKYNSTPLWGETKFRLFGYSDAGDVIPVLRVDSTDIYGTPDTASQSYMFTSPRPIDSIQIAFRWMDSLQQATVAQFITDSLLQDSIARAVEDSLKKANGDTLANDKRGSAGSPTSKIETDAPAKIPNNIAIPQPDVARDSMFQGECDVLDTACLALEEAKNKAASNGSRSCANMAKKPSVNYAEGELDSTNIAEEHCIADTIAVPDSVKKNARPRFTLTGILTETDAPGITYTAVGINGAKVHDYFEEVCPLFEKQLAYYKPDLVIFAIGINDANVQHFNDKQFKDDYDKLIARIKNVNPNAAIIFETNNDMYRKVKKKRYVQHPNGDIARKAFFALAEKHQAGVWDKFSIMGGLGSMAKWEKADLAKADKVHFKLSGYNLLGDLFYKAIINSYQEHIANLPAEPRRENAP
ncbi:GDSL-type esterase/lipase family protein [Fibrobacter sp.]|uniref:GDSL-type esterase/lipase family protein n=1 Tax=Fibrobacter sp. TaxID=35828 RepID=UPI0025B7FD9E|nr:GDSL-type esterase/lipase family protein [Fibrobacter sp.]MCI6437102.1 GDSL-type esterase/lipase family protein [Fibrobacter sp.]MDD7498031.1 GDSL-type esterase/lipase family protein [Fibrobacter sp.]MDY5725108.1 GDSL-type esterase/lipase family protein [Fibrobacter sp.]